MDILAVFGTVGLKIQHAFTAFTDVIDRKKTIKQAR
jgi:hypothetical protein